MFPHGSLTHHCDMRYKNLRCMLEFILILLVLRFNLTILFLQCKHNNYSAVYNYVKPVDSRRKQRGSVVLLTNNGKCTPKVG